MKSKKDHSCTVCKKSFKYESLFKRHMKSHEMSSLLQLRNLQTLPLLIKIIYFKKFHSEFRKNFSTDLFLSYLNNKIATGFEFGLYTDMILIGLQKEFDTINHEIHTNKMEYLRFSKDVIIWFKSYLSNRKIKVNLNKTFSGPGKLLCGVSQGSILGLLLFLLYITNIPQAVKMQTSFICR